MLKEILPVDGLKRGIRDTTLVKCMLLHFLVLTNCKLATDTVEHIEDDQKALREIHSDARSRRTCYDFCASISVALVVRYIILQSQKRYRDPMLTRNRLSEVSMLAAVFSFIDLIFLADIEVEMSLFKSQLLWCC